MSPAVERVLSLFPNAIQEKGGWRALCPAHEDHDPSLRISEGKDGRALLVCRSHGCTLEAITAAIGLTVSDLFHQSNGDKKPVAPKQRTFGKATATHPYHDEQGHVLYEVQRDADKNFRQRKPSNLEPPADAWVYSLEGVRRVPYRLPEVLVARQLGVRIHIVEGEKDAERLIGLGLVATTNSGGAGKWTEELSQYVAGAGDVAILVDNDQPGKDAGEKIAAQLKGKVKHLRIVLLPDLPEKGDVSDYLDTGKTGADLTREIERAPLIKDPSLQLIEVSKPIAAFMRTEYPKPRSLFGDGVMCAGDLAFLYGMPGAGKTWVMLQIILELARGMGPFGLAPPEDGPIRIGVIELELNGFFLKQRLEKLVSADGFTTEQIHLISRPDLKGAVNVLDDEQWSAWMRWTRDLRLDLVVVDALSRAHQVDENKSVEFGPVLTRFDQLRFETGAAVLPIHHEPKPDRSGKELDDMAALRGSSRMLSDSNTLMRYVRAGEGSAFRVLRFPKCNNAPEPDPIWLVKTKSGKLEVTEAPAAKLEKNLAKVQEALETFPEPTIELMEKETKLSRATIYRHIKTLNASKTGDPYRLVSQPSQLQL